MPSRDAAREKAIVLAKLALEKKAERPVILDVRNQSNFCDYFVILSGESTVQVRAIFDTIRDKAPKHDIAVYHTEDDQESRWLLIDCADVVVHVFLAEERNYYDLEYLWKKAKKVPFAARIARAKRPGAVRKRIRGARRLNHA